MIKQKVTEYNSYFLVETRLAFTKKEAKAFDLDKNLKRKVDAIIHRYKRENVEKRNYSSIVYRLKDIKDLYSTYIYGIVFHVYYNIAYLDRKYIILNKQKTFAEEIKTKIKASIDAQFYTKLKTLNHYQNEYFKVNPKGYCNRNKVWNSCRIV